MSCGGAISGAGDSINRHWCHLISAISTMLRSRGLLSIARAFEGCLFAVLNFMTRPRKNEHAIDVDLSHSNTP